MYGFFAISLPAAITCLTGSGASAGATARPSLVIRARPVSVGAVSSTGAVCSGSALAAAFSMALASFRGTTPFTGRPSERSNLRTLRPVSGPNAPSAVVEKPAPVR